MPSTHRVGESAAEGGRQTPEAGDRPRRVGPRSYFSQMSILKTSTVLQTEAQKAIKADVCDPDQTQRQQRGVTGEAGYDPKEKWRSVGVSRIVQVCAAFLPKEVSHHR